MKRTTLYTFLPGLVVLLALLCCACAGNATKGAVDDGQASKGTDVTETPVSGQVDETGSVYGRWVILGRALYRENGEESIGYLPPSASCPLVQAHYCEISESAVTHLIRVYSAASQPDTEPEVAVPEVAEAVFSGTQWNLSWKEGIATVTTDLYGGKECSGILYHVEKDSFTLVFEDSTLPYAPAFVFNRIGQDEWGQYYQRALADGSQDYTSALKVFDDYVKLFGLDHFSLETYL